MIIYLSQGTQTTQNTQMNADLYFFSADRRSPLFSANLFFSADRRSPLFSANLCARLRHLRSPNQPAKFPFLSSFYFGIMSVSSSHGSSLSLTFPVKPESALPVQAPLRRQQMTLYWRSRMAKAFSPSSPIFT